MREVQKKGLKVSESSFFEMLRNHFYCGEVYVPAYLNEPAQYVKGVHEPLISKETFLKVQSRLQKVNKRDKRKKVVVEKYPHEDYYFYQFLLCPHCGQKISASHSKGRNKVYAYYHCNHCGKYRVPAPKMNEDILRYISQIRPCQAVLDLYEAIEKGINLIQAEDKRGIIEDIQRAINIYKYTQNEYYLERICGRFVNKIEELKNVKP